MKILITGAAGFIGSNLAEKLLEKNISVVGIDNFDGFYSKSIKEQNLQTSLAHPNFRFVEADLRSLQDLTEKLTDTDIDVVVHLAAKAGVRPSIQEPLEFIQSNIVSTQNLLDWMKNANCKKLVFASSSSVYGNNEIPFSVTDRVDHPISPYAFTKKSGELMNFTYHHLYQFSILNLRFFTVYGPRQRPDLAIHKFFKKIYNDEVIEVYGDGKTGRDYTFIDDTVSGIIASVDYISKQQEPVYEILNLGNNKPVALWELIECIGKVTGKQIKTKHLPMQQGDVDFTYANIDKTKELLNYSPQTSLFDGLSKFKVWFENN